eukprot:2969655-Pleurochrysis_carterae.AAC.1
MSDKQASTAASCSRAACSGRGGGTVRMKQRRRNCAHEAEAEELGKGGPSEPVWHYDRAQCQQDWQENGDGAVTEP